MPKTVKKKALQKLTVNNLSRNKLFINREKSWLEFNKRVLDEALNSLNPLLEQVKFLSIFTSNLDEFCMVRIAGLKKMLKEGFATCESPDHTGIEDILKDITQTCKEHKILQHEHFNKIILPKLAKENIQILSYAQLSENEKKDLSLFFDREVFPILTPLAVDPSHPYPYLNNLLVYLLIEFNDDRKNKIQDSMVGFVAIPNVLSKLIPLPAKGNFSHRFVLLEDLIRVHLDRLFIGLKIKKTSTIRVIRNLDYTLLENNVIDLLQTMQNEIQKRHCQEAVWLEVSKDISQPLLNELIKILKIQETDVFRLPDPVYIPSFIDLYNLPLKHLKEPSFNPRLPPWLKADLNFFSLIRKHDLLVHHPYESFYTVIDFLQSAAKDDDVLAIKQTLYRTSGDSPIIEALILAAENGKQVTAVVELKARFDEKNNIQWAQRMQRHGVNVVFGFVGLKTHCKMALVVRREKNQLRRYVHLSTGNYNSNTAKIYTDIGLFSARKSLTNEISELFNLLTGFNVLSSHGKRKQAPTFNELAVAPLILRERIIALIDEVIACAKAKGKASIQAKMNGLVDKQIILKLYEASQAGVKISLLVRGICALRPNVPGLSENITVKSIVDRFLEHSRIYCFNCNKKRKVFLASADWMMRCMERRIEIMFPILSKELQYRIVDDIFSTYWNDNTNARILNADGSYTLIKKKRGDDELRAQIELIKSVREDGIKSIPYEKAIHLDPKSKDNRMISIRHVEATKTRK